MAKYKTSIVDGGRKCCYLCGTTHQLEIHHIYSGAFRKLSTQYGLVVTLCASCHRGVNGVHNNYEKMAYLRKIGQQQFNKFYPSLNFMKIFRRNYLDEEVDEDD